MDLKGCVVQPFLAKHPPHLHPKNVAHWGIHHFLGETIPVTDNFSQGEHRF